MNLSDYMTAENLTDEAMAIRIGRSRTTISRLRRGKVLPDWDTMRAILDATNGAVTPDAFLSALGGSAE